MQSELTQAETIAIRALLATFAGTTPLTAANFQTQAQIANAGWKSPADYQTFTMPSTTLEVERRGKWNWIKARGISSVGTITAITNTGIYPFVNGDTIQIEPELGFYLNIQLGGAVGFMLTDSTMFATYMLVGGAWKIVDSNPRVELPTRPDHTIITSATLPMLSTSVAVKYYTGETKATGSVTISASGASGTVEAYVDEGAGTIFLGSYTYTGTPGNNAVATGLKLDIQARYAALEHLYDASVATNVVTVIVPDGRGASATYPLTTVDTGSAVSSALGFGVVNGGTDGIDGAEANGTIEVISTVAADGAVISITNEMAANTLFFDSGAAGSNLASSVTVAALESIRLIFIATLAKWSLYA